MNDRKTATFIFRGTTKQWTLCAVCDHPASCAGEYETCDGNEQPACDGCCGHGNEDGYCQDLPQAHNVRLFNGICPERGVYDRLPCVYGDDDLCKHCDEFRPRVVNQ